MYLLEAREAMGATLDYAVRDCKVEIYLDAKPATDLKMRREARRMSQSELAAAPRVPLRALQQYEQRKFYKTYIAARHEAMFKPEYDGSAFNAEAKRRNVRREREIVQIPYVSLMCVRSIKLHTGRKRNPGSVL